MCGKKETRCTSYVWRVFKEYLGFGIITIIMMVGGPSKINVLPDCPLSSHCPGAQWTIGITDDIRSDTYSLVFTLWLYLFTTSARSSNLQFSCVISSNPSVITPKWWDPQMVGPPPRPILLLRPDRDDAQRRASHASLASVATAKLGMDSYLRRKRRSTLPQILGLPPQAVKASWVIESTWDPMEDARNMSENGVLLNGHVRFATVMKWS